MGLQQRQAHSCLAEESAKWSNRQRELDENITRVDIEEGGVLFKKGPEHEIKD